MSDLSSNLSVEDVVAYFGLSESTIRRRIKTGELKSYKFGGNGKRIIKLEWLREFEANALPERGQAFEVEIGAKP